MSLFCYFSWALFLNKFDEHLYLLFDLSGGQCFLYGNLRQLISVWRIFLGTYLAFLCGVVLRLPFLVVDDLHHLRVLVIFYLSLHKTHNLCSVLFAA